MRRFVLATIVLSQTATFYAQQPAVEPANSPSAPPTAGDVETLRQQVQSLTETVKTLQQQLKDQQAAIEKVIPSGSPALPQNPEKPAVATGESSPAASATPATLFPTEDTSVVAAPSSSAPSPGPGITADGTAQPGAFPTTDSSVVASAASGITTGGSLTAPITIGGGKNYMNISFDGLFALAYSSARDLDRIEVGDHDPQQRGFNARNIELAFDGAVDPYFEGFANIVFKLDNDNETEVEVEEPGILLTIR